MVIGISFEPVVDEEEQDRLAPRAIDQMRMDRPGIGVLGFSDSEGLDGSFADAAEAQKGAADLKSA